MLNLTKTNGSFGVPKFTEQENCMPPNSPNANKWEGIGIKILFPHTSKTYVFCVATITPDIISASLYIYRVFQKNGPPRLF